MESAIRCTCHNEMVPVATSEKIVLCDATLDGIRTGVADLKAGRVRPWSEIRVEMGLDKHAVNIDDDTLLTQ